MNAAHGHSRGHATCSYELGLVPSPPAVSHTPRAPPQQNRNDSASRLLPHGLALFPLAPRKGAAMATAALRGVSRCLASRGSAAATRPMLLAHSRGITYKLFIGGWLLTLIARLQSPPLLTSASVSRLPQSSAPFPLAHLAAGGEARLLHGSRVARACVPSVRRNVRTGRAP
jgi:hypothetical protein